MTRRKLLALLLLNALGILLFFSWYLPENHGFWSPIDTEVFFYFNQHLASSPTFLQLVAATNNRAFDAASLLAMGLIYLHFYLKVNTAGRRRLLITGVVMLLTAVVLNQFGHLLPVKRASPSLSFRDIYRVSELTGIPTKDASSDSFPGDHGIMLMIFACFMLRYFNRWAFALALAVVVIFSLPRIMSGAHWFSDIAVGSLSVVLVGLSWCLLTPLSDWLIDRFDHFLPQRSRLH